MATARVPLEERMRRARHRSAQSQNPHSRVTPELIQDGHAALRAVNGPVVEPKPNVASMPSRKRGFDHSQEEQKPNVPVNNGVDFNSDGNVSFQQQFAGCQEQQRVAMQPPTVVSSNSNNQMMMMMAQMQQQNLQLQKQMQQQQLQHQMMLQMMMNNGGSGFGMMSMNNGMMNGGMNATNMFNNGQSMFNDQMGTNPVTPMQPQQQQFVQPQQQTFEAATLQTPVQTPNGNGQNMNGHTGFGLL